VLAAVAQRLSSFSKSLLGSANARSCGTPNSELEENENGRIAEDTTTKNKGTMRTERMKTAFRARGRRADMRSS